MAPRIDHVDIGLYVYDDNAGHRTVAVSFAPTDEDEPLLELIRKKWHEQSLANLDEAKKKQAQIF